MASCVHLGLLSILVLLPVFTTGNTCLSPQVKSQVYTTSDASLTTETVIILDFSVTCKNGVKDQHLYAEFNGKTYPAARTETDTYQVSWSDEHKAIPSGSYVVQVYDEEGYSDLRKAQRSGEDISAIKPLFTVDFNHAGASNGPWVQSEIVAGVAALFVWYFAYSTKSKMRGNSPAN